jgi:hypothetical protein
MNQNYKNFYKKRIVESILSDKKYITEVERYEMPGLGAIPSTLAMGGSIWDNIGRILGRGGAKKYKRIADLPVNDTIKGKLIKKFGEDARVIGPNPNGSYDIEGSNGRWYFIFPNDSGGIVSNDVFRHTKNWRPGMAIVFLGYDSNGNPIFQYEDGTPYVNPDGPQVDDAPNLGPGIGPMPSEEEKWQEVFGNNNTPPTA